MQKFILLLNISFCFSNVFAQNYSGKIIDGQTQQSLEFANAVLLQSADSAFVAGTVTDSLGNFSLSAKQNNYILKLSFLGYKTKFLDINNKNLGTISLLPDSVNALKEVLVTASRPVYKMEQGGISTDVQNSHLKTLGSAQDVLGQLPFVNRVKDDITVFGKGTPLIYVNNRLVRDNSELAQINSDQIKKITVITNPSAEYDATVRAVIKIETIRQQGDGLSGNIRFGTTIDKRFSHYETVRLNYRHRNLDIFGGFRYGKTGDLVVADFGQITKADSIQTEVITSNNQEAKYQYCRTEIGANYIFSKNHSVGLKLLNSYILTNDFTVYGDFKVLKNNILIEKIKDLMTQSGKPKYSNLNAYYEGKFSEYLSAKLDFDYVKSSIKNNIVVKNFYPDSIETISTLTTGDNNLYAAKLVFESPLWQGTLNYGYEFAKTVANQSFDVLQAGNSEVLQTTQNTANQLLNAAFLIYTKEVGKFTATAGLRYEYVDFKYFANPVKEDEPNRKYNNFFPSASLAYNNDNMQMQLSYKNSTYRPDYYSLRSELQYDNPYSYEQGNPYLKPEKINTLSFMFVLKDLQTEFAYNIYKDRIQRPTVLLYKDKDITTFKPINIDKSQNLSISAAYSPTIEFWHPSLELSFSKDFLHYGNPAIYYHKPVFSVDFKNNFLFFKNLRLGANFSYQTGGNFGLYYFYDNFSTDLFISKQFFKDKLRINLNADDIFGTSRQKYAFTGNEVILYMNKDLNTRSIDISVSYNFNTAQNKYKGEQASAEMNRF